MLPEALCRSRSVAVFGYVLHANTASFHTSIRIGSGTITTTNSL